MSVEWCFRRPGGDAPSETHSFFILFTDAVVLWDFDSEDSNGATSEDSIASYKDVLRTFPTPHIALNHEVSTFAPEKGLR